MNFPRTTETIHLKSQHTIKDRTKNRQYIAQKEGLTGDTLLIHYEYMATTKDRINISVSKGTRAMIEALAKRDQEPVATKAARLLEEALELEEDRTLSAIADERLKNHKGRWLSHEEVWGKIKRIRRTR